MSPIAASSRWLQRRSRHHGTVNSGCSCAVCRQMQSDAARAHGRRQGTRASAPEVRQRLLDAICAGQQPSGEGSDLKPNLGIDQDRQRMVGSPRCCAGGNPPGQPQARHQRGVRGGLCLRGVPRASAGPDGQEPRSGTLVISVPVCAPDLRSPDQCGPSHGANLQTASDDRYRCLPETNRVRGMGDPVIRTDSPTTSQSP